MSRISFRIPRRSAGGLSWFAAYGRARRLRRCASRGRASGRPMTRPSLVLGDQFALDVDDDMGGGVREHADVAASVGFDERHVGDRAVAAVVDRRRRRLDVRCQCRARSDRRVAGAAAVCVIVTFTTAPAPATPSGIANDAHRRDTSARAGVDHPLRCRQLPAVPDGTVERADAVDDDVGVAVAVHADLTARVAADHRQVRRRGARPGSSRSRTALRRRAPRSVPAAT